MNDGCRRDTCELRVCFTFGWRSLGGPELSLTEFVQIIERLAQADGAVGWRVSVVAAFSRFSGFLCGPAARRIDRAIIAGALACAQVATSAGAVVQDLHETAGGAAVYELNLLQRYMRDVQVAAQHFQVHGANFESGGRVLPGMDPVTIHL